MSERGKWNWSNTQPKEPPRAKNPKADGRKSSISVDQVLHRRSAGSKSALGHVEGFCMWLSAQLQTGDEVSIPYVGTIRRVTDGVFEFFPTYVIKHTKKHEPGCSPQDGGDVLGATEAETSNPTDASDDGGGDFDTSAAENSVQVVGTGQSGAPSAPSAAHE